jgi:Raf kinase inhibitor-like YbhB/YbcL family protein
MYTPSALEATVKSMKKMLSPIGSASLAIVVLIPMSVKSAHAGDAAFQLTSMTFQNDSTLPIIMIDNIMQNGSNTCSVDGSTGGDQSPELSWTHAPWGTRTFAVVLYDVTAAFTHWGMYNIPSTAAGLPANAGIAGSTYGSQTVNDFGDPNFDGPCPPKTATPYVHRYVFTVYALDTELHLFSASTNFPANAETLYHALIEAGRQHHILDSATLTGFYSAVPNQ